MNVAMTEWNKQNITRGFAVISTYFIVYFFSDLHHCWTIAGDGLNLEIVIIFLASDRRVCDKCNFIHQPIWKDFLFFIPYFKTQTLNSLSFEFRNRKLAVIQVEMSLRHFVVQLVHRSPLPSWIYTWVSYSTAAHIMLPHNSTWWKQRQRY